MAVQTLSDNCLATQFTSYLGIFGFFALLSTEASIVSCLTIPTCIFSVLHTGKNVLHDPTLLFWGYDHVAVVCYGTYEKEIFSGPLLQTLQVFWLTMTEACRGYNTALPRVSFARVSLSGA